MLPGHMGWHTAMQKRTSRTREMPYGGAHDVQAMALNSLVRRSLRGQSKRATTIPLSTFCSNVIACILNTKDAYVEPMCTINHGRFKKQKSNLNPIRCSLRTIWAWMYSHRIWCIIPKACQSRRGRLKWLRRFMLTISEISCSWMEIVGCVIALQPSSTSG